MPDIKYVCQESKLIAYKSCQSEAESKIKSAKKKMNVSVNKFKYLCAIKTELIFI